MPNVRTSKVLKTYAGHAGSVTGVHLCELLGKVGWGTRVSVPERRCTSMRSCSLVRT